MRYARYTMDDLRSAVASSTSMSGVLRALGLVVAGGGSRGLVRRAIEALGLDVTHWVGQAHRRGRVYPTQRAWGEVLRKGVRVNTNRLRQRLIADGILAPVCVSCQQDVWLGRPIPLELDHVDGDKTNNLLENLRLLCPNCHALTPTYRGKNRASMRQGPSISEIREGIRDHGSLSRYCKSQGLPRSTIRSRILVAQMAER